MKKLDMLKATTGLIVSVGAGAVVGNAIKMSTPADIKTLNKVLVGVGGFVLTGMVGDAASKYAAGQIDDVVEQFSSLNIETTTEDD